MSIDLRSACCTGARTGPLPAIVSTTCFDPRSSLTEVLSVNCYLLVATHLPPPDAVLVFFFAWNSRRSSTTISPVFMLFDLFIWWEWTYWKCTLQLPAASQLSLLSIVCWLRFFSCILFQSAFSPPNMTAFPLCVCLHLRFYSTFLLYWVFYLQGNLASSGLKIIDALNDTAFSVMNQLAMSWRCSAAVVIIICFLERAEMSMCILCWDDMQINYRQIMTAPANCSHCVE